MLSAMTVDGRVRRRRLVSELSVSMGSALVVGLAGKLAGSTVNVPLATPVPLWVTLICTLAAAGVGVSLMRYLRPRRTGKRFFVLVSAHAQKHFVAILLENLIRTLDLHGIDLVVKLPAHDYSGASQDHQLEAIKRSVNDFAGGFIMPAEPDVTRDSLRQFCRSTGIPIVFIDVPPFQREADYPPRTAFVACDPAEIGRNAARYVLSDLAGRTGSPPTVLVVGSDVHVDRHRAFEATLIGALPSAKVIVNERGHFVRERAREIVSQHLREVVRDGGRLDVIYCTNDEMALGAVDAVQARAAQGDRFGDVMVVGVDGTREALATIRTEATPFRATVVQDSGKMAEKAVSLLLRLGSGEPVQVETYLATSMYPPR